MKRKQVVLVLLGRGLAAGRVAVPLVALGVGEAEPERLGLGEGDLDGVADGEADGLLVRATWFVVPGPVAEEAEAAAEDGEAAGRIVVAAPWIGPPPWPSDIATPAPASTAATAPARNSVRRRRFCFDADARSAARVAERPWAVRRELRRAAPGGCGSQTALIAGP